MTESTSQFWRLPLSLAFHSGILHMIVFGILQGVVGSKLEALAGWLRVAMIYFVSQSFECLAFLHLVYGSFKFLNNLYETESGSIV